METIRPDSNGRFPNAGDGIYQLALGNGSQFEVLKMTSGDDIAIGVIGKGVYRFGFPPHPNYVAEKLRVMDGDAENLADFIRDQFGANVPSCGQYLPSLCTP